MCRQLGMPAAQFDDIEAAVAWCSEWLRYRAACARDEDVRLAAIFDIDDTLVQNNQRIELVCQLFDLCQTLRITSFIVTARSEEGGRAYTEDQLSKLNIVGYKRLFMHPVGVPRSAAGKCKSRCRDRVQAHGYTTCLNAGDALHDHFHPYPTHVREVLRPSTLSVFMTQDGVAHLKLPS